MSVYMIIDVKVLDSDQYDQYKNKAKPIVMQHGGKYLSRGDKIYPVSGNWNPERVVLIQFDSMTELKQCFESDEYKKIAHLREQSIISRALIVEGSID